MRRWGFPDRLFGRHLITFEQGALNTRTALLYRAEEYHRKREIGGRRRGNIYRKSTKPFGGIEQLEKQLSEHAFAAGERLPPRLLPAPVAEIQLESSAVGLIEDPSAMQRDGQESSPIVVAESGNLAEASASREQLVDELTSNSIGDASWSSLGLDGFVAFLAERRYGAKATKVQSRLLPALLHSDHRDVIFSSTPGSGKTVALVLAALHAVRVESAGINFIISRNSDVAYATYCLARGLVGSDVGGVIADADAADMSWMLLLEGREKHHEHVQRLKATQRSSRAGARLVFASADVIANLMFEEKIEFAPFGYLRRMYFDDAVQQFNVLRPGYYKSSADIRQIQDNPSAADLLAATVHQIPGPDIRSLLQIAAVSAGIDTALKEHLKSLCIVPQRHSIILAPARVPSQIHCVFSFFQLFIHAKSEAPLAVPLETLEEYLVQLLRNLNAVIPGRAVIFVDSGVCLLTARARLRRLGLDAKIACEVFRDGKWDTEGWRFVVMHEHEGFGVDIPRLSHVFITFCPSDRFALLHMIGRVGRLGSPGWAFFVMDQREAPAITALAGELDITPVGHTITLDLRTCPDEDVQRWTTEGSPAPWDPRVVVQNHYEALETFNFANRELWSNNSKKDFFLEDYRDPKKVTTKFRRARKIFSGMERDPRIIVELYKDGLINQHMRPTARMHALLEGRKVYRYPTVPRVAGTVPRQ